MDNILPQRLSNRGAPASGGRKRVARQAVNFNRTSLRALIHKRLGELARGGKHDISTYGAVAATPHGPGSGVTSGGGHKLSADAATFGRQVTAGGDDRMIHADETMGISPSILMAPKRGVVAAQDNPIRRHDRGVPAHRVGGRRIRQSY